MHENDALRIAVNPRARLVQGRGERRLTFPPLRKEVRADDPSPAFATGGRGGRVKLSAEHPLASPAAQQKQLTTDDCQLSTVH